ncbi:MAG: cytochrome P460 family protein [Polyangia bacterium]
MWGTYERKHGNGTGCTGRNERLRQFDFRGAGCRLCRIYQLGTDHSTAARRGPSASVLGQAHSATDATITRSMYINNNANRGSDGQFPIGTIPVKAHTKGGAMIGGTAMAKRGGDFNPGAKGWEWFVLSASGTIMVRGGADVMGGICNGCHTAAQNTDFVFTR